METPVGAAITVRERVLLELARRDKSDVHATFKAITETSAIVLDVARVSIWEFLGNGSPAGAEPDVRTVCKDLYLLHERRHASSLPLYGRDFPAYLRALHARRTIAADDAQSDPRTREFTDFYLKPLGITSMMDVPIWHHGQVYGVLCLEHVGAMRRWQASEQSFAINMTDIASSCLEAAEHVAVRRRWEAVIESLAEGVLVMDAQGTMIQCNRAARRDFVGPVGGPATLADRMAAADLVDAADRPIPASDWPFPRTVRREIIQGEIYGWVFKRTGEHRYMRLTSSPVVEDGQLKYVVFVIVDVTEEVFFERLKRDLLSGLAHELKTPLAVAKGFAQQLRSSKAIPESSGRMLDGIVRACDRMDHLSETLLDLSSMILGRLRLTRERVDLADLARSVVRGADRGAPNHRFQLEVRGPIPVLVDRTRIAQAIRQVIDNAMAYSPASGTIEVDLSTDEGKAILSVRDQGIGIPANAQRGIFTLFFKAHAGTQHDKGGLGIGLYLAREILRRHGGDMWLESVDGKGSTVHMELPLAETP